MSAEEGRPWMLPCEDATAPVSVTRARARANAHTHTHTHTHTHVGLAQRRIKPMLGG